MLKKQEIKAPVVKITGNIFSIIDAFLPTELSEPHREASSPDQASGDLFRDKRRTRHYLGETGDLDVAKLERIDFYKRIDGSYYNPEKPSRIDLNYVQGDYEARFAAQVLGNLPKKELIKLGNETKKDPIELVEEIEDTKNDTSFGYINENDYPCGLEIYIFTLNGKQEYMISHIDGLEKPKAERKPTIYISPRLYQFFQENEFLSIDKAMTENPGGITKTLIREEEFPRDLFKTIQSNSLSKELRGLFLANEKGVLNFSYGWDESDKPDKSVSLERKPIIPICRLTPDQVPDVEKHPHKEFRSAMEKQIDASARNNKPISTDISNAQWANYVSYLIDGVGKIKGKENRLKTLLFNDDLMPVLKQLKENIMNGGNKNPEQTVKRILMSMTNSNNTMLKAFAKNELETEFRFMADTSALYKVKSSRLTRSSDSTSNGEDPLNSGSQTPSEEGDPEDGNVPPSSPGGPS